LYSLSGNEAAAADVTQQVFLKLISRISHFAAMPNSRPGSIAWW